jgi:hypothetical protein
MVTSFSMSRRARITYRLIAAVAAAVLAGVLILALLLLGVAPRLVFAPGHMTKAILADIRVRAPNFIGVVITFAAWWLIVLALWIIGRRVAKAAT